MFLPPEPLFARRETVYLPPAAVCVDCGGYSALYFDGEHFRHRGPCPDPEELEHTLEELAALAEAIAGLRTRGGPPGLDLRIRTASEGHSGLPK